MRPTKRRFFYNLQKWVAIAWTKGEKVPDTKEPHMSAGRRIAKGRAKRRPYATDADHGGGKGKQMRGLWANKSAMRKDGAHPQDVAFVYATDAEVHRLVGGFLWVGCWVVVYGMVVAW